MAQGRTVAELRVTCGWNERQRWLDFYSRWPWGDARADFLAVVAAGGVALGDVPPFMPPEDDEADNGLLGDEGDEALQQALAAKLEALRQRLDGGGGPKLDRAVQAGWLAAIEAERLSRADEARKEQEAP